MKLSFPSVNKFVLALLLLALVGAMSFGSVSAETADGDVVIGIADDINDPHSHEHEDCVIPDSGPWPPCATGGNDHDDDHADDCVIPPSGPWPPCATGGDGGSAPAPAPAPGNACPASGKWPPGCVPNGGGGTPAPAPAPADGDCVIPESGPWPPCATDGSGSGGNNGADNGSAPAAVSFDELAARVDATQQFLEDYWLGEFKQWGISYQPPALVQTYVGEEGDPPNAFYVPSSNAIFIDLRLLSDIANEYGEFAAVAVLAHEWAHFIQDELDLLSVDRPLRQIELQADCFSGSFTRYLDAIGQLAPGEFEAGQGTFFSVGDDQINPGAPYDQPGAHGTGEERRTAYTYGWDNSANGCRGAYNQ